MSKQEQARQAFAEALSGLGQWDPVVVLGILGDDLHRACGFTGALTSVADLDRLTDDEADALCRILPSSIADLPPMV